MTPSTPDTPSAEVAAMKPSWDLVTALRGGTFAMREAAQTYLPQHPAEDSRGYEYRKSVSTLYEAFSRTVETLASKPFAEPLKLGDDVPADIVKWCDDIDLEGRDLQAFAHAVFTSALEYGLSHVLVEYPRVEGARTLADQRTSGARPYFVHVDPRNILGWRAERINGVRTLTMLRMLECVLEPVNAWETREITQIRILEPTQFTIWRQNEKGDWFVFDSGPVSIGLIPLATVYTGRTGFMQAKPPLMGVAHLNVEHWQSSSDQSNILHVARVPILFSKMLGETTVKVGGAAGVNSNDPAGEMMYVEHSGRAIDAGRQSLLDLEERMAVMGAELLVTKPGVKTATEAAGDTAESNSALAAMVHNLEDTLALALAFAAKWENLGPNGGSVHLNDDFGGAKMDVEGLLAARKIGIISSETVFAELQRCGIISDEIVWEEEWARLITEGTPIAVGGSYESPNLGGPDPKPGTAAAVALGEVTPNIAPPPSAERRRAWTGFRILKLGVVPGLVLPHPPMPDFGPLIAAIQAHITREMPAPVINVTTPDVVVNSPITVSVPEQPAPVINIAPAAVTVNTPDVHVAAPTINVTVPEQPAASVTVEAPNVTVNTPDVTYNAPSITVNTPDQTINVAPPEVNVAAPAVTVQPAQVVQPKASAVKFQTNAAGEITGATLK
jgi:hypothetical protein